MCVSYITCVFVFGFMNVCVSICVSMCVSMCVSVCVSMSVLVPVSMSVAVSVFVSVSVSMSVSCVCVLCLCLCLCRYATWYGMATISRLLKGSFAKDPYKRDYILQKRPTILRRLLRVATPYRLRNSKTLPHTATYCNIL